MADGDRKTHDAAAGLLELARQAQRLKQVARQGWLDRGVPAADVESVADHSFGVALLAWLAALTAQSAGEAIDPTRVLQLAIIHDLPEAVIGDWTPYAGDAIPTGADAAARAVFLDQRQTRSPERSAAKRAAEHAAIEALADALPQAAASPLRDLWAELAAGTSQEARFLKQVDRLETYLQSRAYLEQDATLPMGSFAAEAAAEITHPLLAEIRDNAN
ncbi:MAG: HD domain-containing protein [Thermomicrobiales bacterium]